MIDAIVDLSHWNPNPIDFAAVKSAGIAAVILKATQGSHWIDATFADRAIAASDAGLLVGAYHFADASDPAAQVAHFLSVADGEPVLAIDVEQNSIPGGTVSIMQAAEMVARLQMATGRLPLVYMGRYGIDGHGTGLPNSVLSRAPLWLPEYGNKPVPPKGWTDWTLWQYTDRTAVPGIGGLCNRNRFAGTMDALSTWWGS